LTGSPAGQVAMVHIRPGSIYSQAYVSIGGSSASRPPSHGLESETADVRSLWLASRFKPWLRTTHGLRQLMADSHGLQNDANRKISRRKLDTKVSSKFSELTTKVDSHISLSDDRNNLG